jgi:hypothetical protein
LPGLRKEGRPGRKPRVSAQDLQKIESLSAAWKLWLRNRFVYGMAAEETVLTDVRNAFEAAKNNEEIVTLYQSGYLDQAKESRDISEFSYRQGAASLLDLLDAERSYRSSQLGYRQALANYMVAVQQLRQAQGLLK